MADRVGTAEKFRFSKTVVEFDHTDAAGYEIFGFFAGRGHFN